MSNLTDELDEMIQDDEARIAELDEEIESLQKERERITQQLVHAGDPAGVLRAATGPNDRRPTGCATNG